MIVLEVLGTPAPKGSVQAFVCGGRAQVVTGGAASTRVKMKAWDAAVRHAACEWMGTALHLGGPRWIRTPIAITIVFRLMRPGGHWARRGGLKPSAPRAPIVKPDIDKLIRTTLDAMTGILFDDDSCVVELQVTKRYATAGTEGATITVTQWAVPEVAAIANDAEQLARYCEAAGDLERAARFRAQATAIRSQGAT